MICLSFSELFFPKKDFYENKINLFFSFVKDTFDASITTDGETVHFKTDAST